MFDVVSMKKSMAEVQQDLCTKFSDKRYIGFYQFTMPSLIVRDPNLIKTICITEFDKFCDHTDFLPKETDPFWKKILFARTGKKWKDMRMIVNPAFSTAKVKAMSVLVDECSRNYLKHLLRNKEDSFDIEMRDFYKRYINDITASYVYGIKCDSFQDKDNSLFLTAKRAFSLSGIKYFKFLGYSISPFLMNLFRIVVFDEKTKSYFRSLVEKSIDFSEAMNLARSDFLYYIKQKQKQRQNGEKGEFQFEITDDDLLVQVIGFYFASFETSVALMCNMFYELALNPDIQDKLAQEIQDYLKKHDGKVDYDTLTSLPYLNMVVSETLRLRSPAMFLNRKCVKPFTIEPTSPGEKPLHLEPGTDITVPLYALFRDPNFYPEPERFMPERFDEDNKHLIAPNTYLPFGLGPRICLGAKLATMQTKIISIHILSQFKVLPMERTTIPFEMSRLSITYWNDKDYWLRLEKRKL